MNQLDLKKCALKYAELGFKVFPIMPGRKKPPLVTNGLHDGTSKKETIDAWWEKYPEANIGVHCGASELIAVDLDIDKDKDGITAWEKLIKDESLSIPAHWTARTPRGGVHLVFKMPEKRHGNANKGLPTGIDMRGDGGYIVLAPSKVDGKYYKWNPKKNPLVGSEIAPLPLRVLEIANRKNGNGNGKPVKVDLLPAPTNGNGNRYADAALEYELDTLARSTEGNRNAQLNTSAFSMGTLVGAGALERGLVEGQLFSVARGIGLDESEIYQTLKSGLEAGIKQPRAIPEPTNGRENPADVFCRVEVEQPGAQPLEKVEKAREVDLPSNKIHPMFKAYWQQFEGQCETAKEYCLSALLTGFGACLGNRTRLKVGGGIVPNLYCVLVGSSTYMRKTTGLDLGIQTLSDISNQQRRNYYSKMEFWEESVKDYEQLNKHEKRITEHPKKRKPKDDSFIYPNECSPEKLLEKMSEKSDGLFCYSELGGLLARLDSGYMAGFKEKLTEFYDGRRVMYVRETKSGGAVIIENAAPSLVACSTFEWLQQHLKQDDLFSGFLARFLFVVRRDYPKTPIPIQPYFEPSEEWKSFHNALTLFDTTLTLSEAAEQSYCDWYVKFREAALKEDKALHSFMGRLQTACHKIAIINHALSALTEADHPTDVIPASSYEMAYPWIDFFCENIKSCYSEITQATDHREDKILQIVKQRGKESSGGYEYGLTYVCRYAHLSKKELQEVMETLEMKALAKIVKKGKRQYVRIAK